eukprot:12274218-Alexandrium_andersonii.AAC.1
MGGPTPQRFTRAPRSRPKTGAVRGRAVLWASGLRRSEPGAASRRPTWHAARLGAALRGSQSAVV